MVVALRLELPTFTVAVLLSGAPTVRRPPPSPPLILPSNAPLLVKPLATVSAAVPPSATVPLLLTALFRVNGVVSDSTKVPALLGTPLPPLLKANVAGWLAEP